jgi:hypothetical protein
MNRDVGFHVSPTGDADHDNFHFTVDFIGSGRTVTQHVYYDWNRYNQKMLRAGEPLAPPLAIAMQLQRRIYDEAQFARTNPPRRADPDVLERAALLGDVMRARARRLRAGITESKEEEVDFSSLFD